MLTMHEPASGSQLALSDVIYDPIGDFWDILMADDEWLRREFEELIDAGWGEGQPPGLRVARGRPRPRRPRILELVETVRRLRPQVDGTTNWRRQRGPPERS